MAVVTKMCVKYHDPSRHLGSVGQGQSHKAVKTDPRNKMKTSLYRSIARLHFVDRQTDKQTDRDRCADQKQIS